MSVQNVAFLFSGQGAQVPGMGEELYKISPAARMVFDTADRVLERKISHLCFRGTQEALDLTHNTQPCMLAVDLAAFAVITERGWRPDAVAGFSLGEYAAIVAANVISMEDAFKMIQIRADAMQEAVPLGQGAMAAVTKISPQKVEELCAEVEGYVIPANFNSMVQTVVSGEAEAVDNLLELAKERKIMAMKLPVSAPFHCKLMEPAAAKLKHIFEKVCFRDASFPIYMNFDGKAHTTAEDIRRCVIQQAVSPVRWVDTIEQMSAAGVDQFVELGVGHTLKKFVKNIVPSKKVASLQELIFFKENS